MQYAIDGFHLDFHCGYRENGVLCAAFNRLVMDTFDLDFEPWRRQGFWTDAYLPYTLFEGDRAVANVSASEMRFRMGSRELRCVQLGTVMTAPDRRGHGLSRWLMERVLSDWRARCDFFYLYANDSVLDYYPRFGFRRVREYQDVRLLQMDVPRTTVRRLDLNSLEDRGLLLRCYRQYSNPFSALSMEENNGLLMFYAIGPLCDAFYYLEELDAVAVASAEAGVLCCEELFAHAEVPLDVILHTLACVFPGSGIRQVRFGFSLQGACASENILLEEPDTTLFVLNSEENIFDHKQMRFPLLSHA